jgi:hypothetical protein
MDSLETGSIHLRRVDRSTQGSRMLADDGDQHYLRADRSIQGSQIMLDEI